MNLTHRIEKAFEMNGLEAPLSHRPSHGDGVMVSYDDGLREATTYTFPALGITRITHVKIERSRRGEGHGRHLVRTLEEMSGSIDCPFLLVGYCTNNSFWKEMGYKRIGPFRRLLLDMRWDIGSFPDRALMNPYYRILTPS